MKVPIVAARPVCWGQHLQEFGQVKQLVLTIAVEFTGSEAGDPADPLMKAGMDQPAAVAFRNWPSGQCQVKSRALHCSAWPVRAGPPT